MAYPSKVEYMIFPRMMALSEVLWTPKNKRDWKDFERRLPAIYKRMQTEKLNYSTAYYDLQATVLPTEDNAGVLWKIESTNINAKIQWIPSLLSSSKLQYEKPILVKETVNGMSASLNDENGKTLSSVSQSFHFNKATGKKITLVTPPSKSYPGDGAFTLVNGVQNELKLSRSNEFLGFNGTDLDATIDLGQITDIKKVTLHILEQPGSWIYAPSKVDIQYSMSLDTDQQAILRPAKMSSVTVEPGKGLDKVTIESVQNCRYIRVVAKNLGTIPSGNPGAGNPAWLFADEIEVE
jgi:hexosaminidase